PKQLTITREIPVLPNTSAYPARHRAARSRWRAVKRSIAFVATTLLISTGLVVGTGFTSALADANIELSVTADGNVLAGEGASVTMTATNLNATTDYYNLSFRYELPQGVAYKSGSSTLPQSPSPTLPDPVIITIVDLDDGFGNPILTHQVLIWSNVSDLQH